MIDTVVGLYTIGQTPRPDLTGGFAARFGSVAFETRGALDGLSEDRIPACRENGYPLETRLRDGTRLVVDAAFLEPRLQEAIAQWDDHVQVHMVLCAGSFPLLRARKTLIQPFDAAIAELKRRGLTSLAVVVPFSAQAAPSIRKWEAAGFSCRSHALDQNSEDSSVVDWLRGRLVESSAEALVLDYVGFPAATLDQLAAGVDVPVLDLGHLAMDALERTLETL